MVSSCASDDRLVLNTGSTCTLNLVSPSCLGPKIDTYNRTDSWSSGAVLHGQSSHTDAQQNDIQITMPK